MAVYLIQLGYSAEAVRAMVKTPQSREETARAAVEFVGGKLHSFHFAFGEFDAVMIAEVPNNASALATALAATAVRLHVEIPYDAADDRGRERGGDEARAESRLRAAEITAVEPG